MTPERLEPIADVRDHTPLAANSAAAAGLAGAVVRLQTVLDHGLSGAGDRAARGIPDLSARPRRLARLHRHHHRPPRRVRRFRKLPVPADRPPMVERGFLQRSIYGYRDLRKIRARLLAGAALEQPFSVQEPAARHHPAALDRAD